VSEVFFTFFQERLSDLLAYSAKTFLAIFFHIHRSKKDLTLLRPPKGMLIIDNLDTFVTLA
jgi:hypothetical protein